MTRVLNLVSRSGRRTRTKGLYEHRNKCSVRVTCGEFLENLGEHCLLKTYFARWNQSHFTHYNRLENVRRALHFWRLRCVVVSMFLIRDYFQVKH